MTSTDWSIVPDLLPCPFCGSTDVEHNPGGNESFVSCNACGATGPDAHGEDAPAQAARKWNNAVRHGADRWVPVGERLPELWTKVLVAVRKGPLPWSEGRTDAAARNGDHEGRFEGDGGWIRHEDVTHWKPWPPPPKEADDAG